MKTFLAVLPFLLALGCGAAQSVPPVGAAAPSVALPSQEGKTVTLKDFPGRWIVLYFYPKDFTSGCTIEANNFQADLKKYEQRGAVILGVSVQDAGSHKDFCAKEGLAFRLLADTDRSVSKAYGSLMNLKVAAFSARNTFLIDPQGVIRKEFIRVDPSRHSAEVLAALDELQKSPAKGG